MKRHSYKLVFSNTRKHELHQERWTPADNLATFDQNLEDLHLELGIA